MSVGRCLRFYCFSKKDIISVIIFRVLFQARQTTNALGTTITCEWHICSGFPNPVPFKLEGFFFLIVSILWEHTHIFNNIFFSFFSLSNKPLTSIL